MKNFYKLIEKSNFFLAPIAGFTDSPFRRVVRRHGAGPVLTELISSEGLIRNNKKSLDLAKFHEEERPIGIQIFGNSPEIMGEAAAILMDLKPDFIDINMGCPSKKVSKSGIGSGAALLLFPDKIRIIVEQVVKNSSVPVSAKIRIGWDEKNRNYHDVVKAIEHGGASFIIVHGRTGSQKYSGSADWNIIRAINKISSVPVVGNGDIISNIEAEQKIKFSECPAIMIGRGALGNPWIFSNNIPSINELIHQIKEHLRLMIDYYGEKGLVLMRKHLVKYIHGIKNASSIRKKLVTSKSEIEIHEMLESLIDNNDFDFNGTKIL